MVETGLRNIEENPGGELRKILRILVL